eukprot:3902372-Alexandrium_andersonii.AAC.1
MQIMLDEVSERICSAGFSWKPGSMQALFSLALVEEQLTVGAYDVPAVPSMVVLGSALDRRGSTKCSLEHRAVAAEKHFGAMRA